MFDAVARSPRHIDVRCPPGAGDPPAPVVRSLRSARAQLLSREGTESEKNGEDQELFHDLEASCRGGGRVQVSLAGPAGDHQRSVALFPLEERKRPAHTEAVSPAWRWIPTVVLAAGLGWSGCTSGRPASAPGPPSPAPTSAAPTSAARAAGASTTATPSVPSAPATTSRPAPVASTCTVPGLGITVARPIGSAGSLHYQLVFRNGTSSPCRLYGYPGVSFLDSRGDQIGPPARQGTAVAAQVVTLAPGAEGYVGLDVTDPGIPPCAGPGSVARIRVYPPGSYSAALVAPPAGMQVCTSANTSDYIATTVGPLTAAPSPGYTP